MLPAPQVEPISNLRRDHTQVLQKLKKGPVFLAQRGSLTAALISIEEWNKIAERLTHVEALLRARRLHEEIELDPTKSITHEELMQKLGAQEACGD